MVKPTRENGSSRLSATQVLNKIKPVQHAQRFLVSWQADRRELSFGCGGNRHAVVITSARRLSKAMPGSVLGTRFSAETVRKFRAKSGPVDGRDLLKNAKSFISDYVHFCDQRRYSLLGAWTIGTYLYPIFSHFGYLVLWSKFWRSGKTRTEEILSHLCFEAQGPLNSPTVATIRDTAAEGRTLILDTLERWKGKSAEAYSAAMEILDAGFRNGGAVAKMVRHGDEWRKEVFTVYAPYILAAINRASFSDTALDRSFVIEMERKPRGVKKTAYSHPRCEQAATSVRECLYLWALQNALKVANAYESPGLEEELAKLELNDRATDIWRPLLAVAKVVNEEELWRDLSSLAREMGRDTDLADDARNLAIVQGLRRYGNGEGEVVGMTSQLIEHLGAEKLSIGERELHDLLESWGFSQTEARLECGPRRAWKLKDEKLAIIEGQLYVLDAGMHE